MRFPSIALLALALAACGSPAPAAPAPKPAVWKLSDPDTTIYLFGSIHLLPEGFQWRTARFGAIEKSAGELVLEIADQGDRNAVANLYRKMALKPGLPPLLDRVPADKRAAMEAMIKKTGLQPGQLDGYKTWAAALTLGTSVYSGAGVSSDNGVEKQLTADFEGAKKPVAGLETTAQQLGYFDMLSEDAQRKLLVSIVDDEKDAAAEFRTMMAAWSKGDTAAIAATFDDELKQSPDLTRVLLERRNANWVEWLKGRLHKPGTVLVAVGAGHLAGKGSVIDRLKAQGLKIERVQ